MVEFGAVLRLYSTSGISLCHCLKLPLASLYGGMNFFYKSLCKPIRFMVAFRDITPVDFPVLCIFLEFVTNVGPSLITDEGIHVAMVGHYCSFQRLDEFFFCCCLDRHNNWPLGKLVNEHHKVPVSLLTGGRTTTPEKSDARVWNGLSLIGLERVGYSPLGALLL